MNIRLATYDDIYALNEIYNQSIPSHQSTCDTIPVSLLRREKWLEEHYSDDHPVFVAEMMGNVAGWISLSPYREDRQALRFTKEVSYYVKDEFQRHGIGTQLLKYIIDYAQKKGFKTLFAILLENNVASIKLLKKFHFHPWGHLPKVADFNGKEIGQYIYGLRISNN